MCGVVGMKSLGEWLTGEVVVRYGFIQGGLWVGGRENVVVVLQFVGGFKKAKDGGLWVEGVV